MKTNAHILHQFINRFTLGVALSVLIVSGRPVFAADLYQWQDENGVEHFTDKPPLGKNAKKVKVKTTKPSGSAAQTDDEQISSDQKNPDAERCESERKRLQVLQSNLTVRMRGQDGSMRELNEQEMQEEIAFSQAAIERFCK